MKQRNTKYKMGKIFVISVVSHRQSKTLINNTALEVDDMDSTFIELYEIVKSRPQCQEILQDYSYDDIVKIQITQQTQASASIEVSPNMKIGTCEDLNCKFIQFHISSKESIPKTSPCDPHKPSNQEMVLMTVYTLSAKQFVFFFTNIIESSV